MGNDRQVDLGMVGCPDAPKGIIDHVQIVEGDNDGFTGLVKFVKGCIKFINLFNFFGKGIKKRLRP